MKYSEDIEKHRNMFLSQDGLLRDKQMKDVLIYKYQENNDKIEKIEGGKYILSLNGFDVSKSFRYQPCVIITNNNGYCDLMNSRLKELSDQGIDLEFPYDFYPLFWFNEGIGGYLLGFLRGFFPGTLVVM